MKYIIFVLILISLIISFHIISNVIIDKKIFKLLNSYNDKYTLIKSKKYYDYVLRRGNLDIYVCILKIPRYSQICINSKDTWKLSYNTFKNDNSKAYSNSRYLDEIKYFLKNDIKTEKQYLKLIFVYKGYNEIIRYLNETELDVIDINKSPYGYKITSFNTFDKDIDVILNFNAKNN